MTLNLRTWALLACSLLFLACSSDTGSGSIPDDIDSGSVTQDGSGSLDGSGPDDTGLTGPCDPECGDSETCEEGQCIGLPCELDCGAHGTCI
jgi:hypothetical protein